MAKRVGGTKRLIGTIIAPVFLAGAAAAILSAPVAGATTGDCSDNGATAICTRGGHASIYAEPRSDLHQFSTAPLWSRAQAPLLATE